MYRYNLERRTDHSGVPHQEGQPVTLRCQCGALELTIVSQSYGDGGAFEAYECQCCGRTGTLLNDDTTGTTLSGCLR